MNLFIAALLVGLATSFHCVAMCGPLVLTYAVKDETEGPWLRRMLPHLAYQGAKIVSYVIVGLLLGSVGLLLGLDESLGGLRGYFIVVASVLMVLLGLQMTGRFPALNRFVPRPPEALVRALSRTRSKARAEAAEGKVSLGTPVTFGLLTGLMPCAPLMAQQAAAAASGSPVSGATIMLGFGLGTVPLMLGFGAVAGALSH
ncbi:MAG: sulfite exporter TauE/SafE family protein, partial [Actinobacteria bacterium]